MSSSVIKGIKLHAIRTEDESVWIDFNGEVPRVGDVIDLGAISSDHEISDELKSKRWIAYEVRWFFLDWRTSSHPWLGLDAVTWPLLWLRSRIAF